MAEKSLEFNITPDAAAKGGCSASVTRVYETMDGDYWFGRLYSRHYELSHTEGDGWEFLGFKWTTRDYDSYGGYEINQHGTQSVGEISESWWDYTPTGGSEYDPTSELDSTTIEAVFSQIEYHVYAEADVGGATRREALAAGCTASVDPRSRAGVYGERASFTFTARAADGWRFVSWSDGSTDATHVVSEPFGTEKTKTVSLTATFEEIVYVVRAEASVEGADASAAGCTATVYPPSRQGVLGSRPASFTFTARAADGWRFVSWSDGSTDATHTVSEPFGPNEFKTVSLSASFEREGGDYEICGEALVNGNDASAAGCTASVSPVSQYGDLGETATLTFTAEAAPFWVFVAWSDGSTDATHEVSETFGPEPTKTVSLTATFRNGSGLLVSVSSSPANAATVTGGGVYVHGQTCTIDALAKCSPWTFDHWELSPGGTVDVRRHSFSVQDDTTCVAHFRHSDTKMPYDVGGKILCSSSGDILYDGDE